MPDHGTRCDNFTATAKDVITIGEARTWLTTHHWTLDTTWYGDHPAPADRELWDSKDGSRRVMLPLATHYVDFGRRLAEFVADLSAAYACCPEQMVIKIKKHAAVQDIGNGVTIEPIGPEEAQLLLYGCPVQYINSRLSASRTATYTRTMRDGTWEGPGDTIPVLTDGRVINGLNRLTAIVMSGTTQILELHRDADPDTFEFTWRPDHTDSKDVPA